MNIPSYAVLLIFLSILLSVLCEEIRKKYKIALPPLLIVISMLLSCISQYIGLGPLHDLIGLIDKKTLILVLVPPIIFKGAMTIDWHIFKKEIVKLVILSTSQFFISSLILAVIVKYITSYNFEWNYYIILCILLNSSDYEATKNVAKRLHMDSNINSLMIGKSLTNEIAVINIIVIMVNNSFDDIIDVGFGIYLFFKNIIVGLLIGLGISYIMGKIIKRFVNDFIQESNLTICNTFLSFLVAEVYAKSSGVMSVIAFGLYMSAYGKTLISPTIEKNFCYIWSVLSAGCESIVFFIGGMLLGYKIFISGSYSLQDSAYLITIYFLHIAIQLMVLAAHYTILKKVGSKITFKKIILLSLSGIKGSISIALTIYIHNSGCFTDKFNDKIVFFGVLLTLMTITINPLILRYAEKKLKYEKLNEVQENLLLGLTRSILKNTKKKLKKLEKSKEFPLVKWSDVMETAGPRELVITVMKRSKFGKKILQLFPKAEPEVLIKNFFENVLIDEEDKSAELRRRFYTSLKGIYWKEFETGQCMGETSLLLIKSTSSLMSNYTEPIKDWEYIENQIKNLKLLDYYKRFFEKPVINGIFRKLASNLIVRSYDTASTYLKAHKKTKELFENMEFDQDIVELISYESKIQEKLCKRYINQNLISTYPEIISEVQSKMVLYSLLISQRKLINKIYQQGVIPNLEHNYLLTSIDANFKALTFLSSSVGMPLKYILRKAFKNIPKKGIDSLLPYARLLQLRPGEVLYEEKKFNDGAFLVITGRIREYGNWIDQELTNGNIVGVQYLIPGISEFNLTTAVALTVATIVQLPRMIANFDFLEEYIYKEAAEEFLILNKEKFNLKNSSNDQIIFVVGKSYVKRVYEGSLINMRRGGFVLKGRIRIDKSCYSLLRPTRKKIESIDNALLLIFPSHFSSILRYNRNISDAFAEYYIRNSKKKTYLREFFTIANYNVAKRLEKKRETRKLLEKGKDGYKDGYQNTKLDF